MRKIEQALAVNKTVEKVLKVFQGAKLDEAGVISVLDAVVASLTEETEDDCECLGCCCEDGEGIDPEEEDESDAVDEQ